MENEATTALAAIDTAVGPLIDAAIDAGADFDDVRDQLRKTWEEVKAAHAGDDGDDW